MTAGRNQPGTTLAGGHLRADYADSFTRNGTTVPIPVESAARRNCVLRLCEGRVCRDSLISCVFQATAVGFIHAQSYSYLCSRDLLNVPPPRRDRNSFV